MSDFQQRGPITTLPRLTRDRLERIESELCTATENRPLTLAIPCLASEMDQQALAWMAAELAKVPYLDSVLIALDRAEASDYQRALQYFRALAQRTVVMWNDAPEVLEVLAEVEASVGALPAGKGRGVWLAIGYILAEDRARAVALHDADVVDYDRSLLANLVLPIIHSELSFSFAKAYYARFRTQLYGRATRLLMRPLLQTLGEIIGHHPYLSYLAAFRYPLAGEMALETDLLRLMRIPGDWGIEVGLLFEILRHRSPRRICQVEIADAFDHKHQGLYPDDPTQGLHRMAVDIVKHLLRTLAAAGVVLQQGSFQGMRVAYQRFAEDAVADAYAVSVFNGLTFDRHAEEEAVDTFSRALAEGCEQFLTDPLGTPSLPNWARVLSALPNAGTRLVDAVRRLDGVLAP
jgi:glucosyl-3-phosphoglycerate synthase